MYTLRCHVIYAAGLFFVSTNAEGREAMEMILTEAINAINEMSRHAGFAPIQWVLSRFPRSPATLGDEEERANIGAIQAHVDGPTAFALQGRYRQHAREASIRWDCSGKVQRALLRKAAHVPRPYNIGDIVSYFRKAREGDTGIR